MHEVLEIPGVAGLGVLPRLDALGLVQQGAMIAKDLQVRNRQMSEYRIMCDMLQENEEKCSQQTTLGLVYKKHLKIRTSPVSNFFPKRD